MLTQHCQLPRISLCARLGEAHEIFTDCHRISVRCDDYRRWLDRMVVRWPVTNCSIKTCNGWPHLPPGATPMAHEYFSKIDGKRLKKQRNRSSRRSALNRSLWRPGIHLAWTVSCLPGPKHAQ